MHKNLLFSITMVTTLFFINASGMEIFPDNESIEFDESRNTYSVDYDNHRTTSTTALRKLSSATRDEKHTASFYLSSLTSFSDLAPETPEDILFHAIQNDDAESFIQCLKANATTISLDSKQYDNNIVTAILRKTPYTSANLHMLSEFIKQKEIKDLSFKIPILNRDLDSDKETTLLHLAIESLNFNQSRKNVDIVGRIVDILLQCSADPYLSDSNHTNAIVYAQEKGYVKLAKYLEEKTSEKSPELALPQKKKRKPCIIS